MICGYKECGKEFTPPAKHKAQKYCNRLCANRSNQIWKLSGPGVRRARIARREKRLGELEQMSREEIDARAYRRGFDAARYHYHYRQFLRGLRDALTVSSSGVPGGSR